jgi:putative hydrolase of the HAD superfamily
VTLRTPDTLAAPIRCILFDAVGTLIYPDPPVADAYHAAACEFGSRLSVAEIARRFRFALASAHNPEGSDGKSFFRPLTSEAHERDRWRQVVGQVIDDVDPADAESLFQHLWVHFAQPQHWRVYGDVEPALAALASRGFRLGIASNFDGRLRPIVSGHPPLRLGQEIFVSSEVGFIKPDLRFFATVTARLGVPAGQILLVGDDALADIAAASASGWRSLLLDRALREPTPAAINSLTSLSAVIGPDF